MKETNGLRKELEKIKKQCTHCMASKEIKDTKLEQKHYLFNCRRMDSGGTKRIYKRLKKAIHDKQNLAEFKSCTKCFMPFE